MWKFLKISDRVDISIQDKGLYVFGGFIVDPLKTLLMRNGVPISLSPNVFDTQLILIEHADRLLDKVEMREERPRAFGSRRTIPIRTICPTRTMGAAVNIEQHLAFSGGITALPFCAMAAKASTTCPSNARPAKSLGLAFRFAGDAVADALESPLGVACYSRGRARW